jgi:hypothetical protein
MWRSRSVVVFLLLFLGLLAVEALDSLLQEVPDLVRENKLVQFS